MNRIENVLEEMADIEDRRKDLNIPMSALRMEDEGVITSKTYGELEPSKATINRLCGLYKLNTGHIDTLAAEGRNDLIADQFNHFLKKDKSQMKLRLVDNRIKGVVPTSYKKFDDHALFWQIYEYLMQTGMDYDIDVLNKDDEYTRIRFMIKDIEKNMGSADEGGLDSDVVQGGFEVTNSEIGMKGIGLNSLVYRLICTNGMMDIIGDDENREIFGKRDRDFNPYSRKRKLNNGLDMTITKSSENIQLFKKTKDIIVENPRQEIDKISNKYKLTKSHNEGIQEAYKKEQQRNMYGIVNSLSRFGRNFNKSDYKNRSKLEFIANDVLHTVTS
jgi:hypothetical protein